MEKSINFVASVFVHSFLTAGVGGVVSAGALLTGLFLAPGNLLDGPEPAYTIGMSIILGTAGGVVPGLALGILAGAVSGFRQQTMHPRRVFTTSVIAGIIGGIVGAGVVYLRYS